MRTVILTGGTGFIGSAVLRELRRSGLAVVMLKRSTSDTRRIADVLGKDSAVTSHDIDTVALREVFSRHPAEVVIHVATEYARATGSLSGAIESNVLFPTRLLEEAAASGASAFINTDTFSARAAELPQGLDGYVLTKKHFRQCGEMLAERHGLRFVNLRVEHAYGPGDGADKFVPTLLRALLAGAPGFDLTPGEQVRDFVYRDDVARAFVAVVNHLEELPPGPSNLDVGTGRATSLRSMVELAREISRSGTELRFGALPYRVGELMRSVADIAPLERLGCTAEVDLREGLARTIEAARG